MASVRSIHSPPLRPISHLPSPTRHFSTSQPTRQQPIVQAESTAEDVDDFESAPLEQRTDYSPPPSAAAKSAKLAALHARLSLPARFPIQTLARCLVDASADPRPEYNNSSLSLLGQDLLGYYTAEWLICNYPRLPMDVILASQFGYVGPKTLDSMRREWGVEVAAAPGEEVDAGLLQLNRVAAGNSMAADGLTRLKNASPTADNSRKEYHRGMAFRNVSNDMFGDRSPSDSLYPVEGSQVDTNAPSTALQAPQAGSTLTDASATFIRALFGALYLHSGLVAAKSFHQAHVLSRHLPLHTLFAFKHPTRDLSRLCAREALEAPVARLLSETGRHSRSPVFIVGVYSGQEKLGEGEGSSLDEARVRAAANALRSWYLYSPAKEDVVLPSEVEGAAKSGKVWKSQMIDCGEIVT